MKYVKLYDTHTEHEVDKSDLMKLDYACTYCKDNKDSWFWYKRDIYADQYLTFESLEDGNTFKNANYPVQYSLDNGQTWTRLGYNSNTPVINLGEKIMFKASITPLGTSASQNQSRGVGKFSSTANFNVMGNPLSLIFSDNFIGQTDLTGLNYCFELLFYNCNKLISAEHLSLPATTLVQGCYYGMFNGCTSLTKVPELPATTLASSCYSSMFGNCTSLTTIPELPATTLANNCYLAMFGGCTSLTTALELPATTLTNYCYCNMFGGCTSLTTAPELPATTLADDCYSQMFNGCTSLTTAPELPATTLVQSCYSQMFKGCTSLTTAPELPAITLAPYCYSFMFQDCTSLIIAPSLSVTTLAQACYHGMFQGCTSLTTAPELPATTLATGCYQLMFKNCTSLTTAPELPATTLATICYVNMFNGCSNLNYIKAMFTTTPSATYTSSWVLNVSSTGTFIKNSSATWDVTGTNGVPSGWTVQYADS